MNNITAIIKSLNRTKIVSYSLLLISFFSFSLLMGCKDKNDKEEVAIRIAEEWLQEKQGTMIDVALDQIPVGIGHLFKGNITEILGQKVTHTFTAERKKKNQWKVTVVSLTTINMETLNPPVIKQMSVTLELDIDTKKKNVLNSTVIASDIKE